MKQLLKTFTAILIVGTLITIIFFGGIYFGISNSRFDIYDLTTNSWSIGVLPQNTGGSIISYNNTLYVTEGNQFWKLVF